MDTLHANDFLGTILNRFESETFTISVVEYTMKVSEEFHWHEKSHISSIILGGNLESREKKDIQVTPGDVLAYSPGEIHRNRFTKHPSRNLNIEFEPDFFGQGIDFSTLKLDDDAKIRLHRAYFELLNYDSFSADSIDQLLQSLFWEGKPERNTDWVAQLETLLNDRWDEFPSLEELSKELKVHPVTISKFFPKHTGMTLSDYMRKLKVRRAVNLLINSSKSITEIVFICGFSDQSHMTRLVKKHTGYTPGKIRTLV